MLNLGAFFFILIVLIIESVFSCLIYLKFEIDCEKKQRFRTKTGIEDSENSVKTEITLRQNRHLDRRQRGRVVKAPDWW